MSLQVAIKMLRRQTTCLRIDEKNLLIFFVRPLSLGFTLLEVMISLAIVGGLLISLIYTLNYHLGIAETHSIITISTSLAKVKLHELEITPAVGSGTFEEPFLDYSYETDVRNSSFLGMSQISVTVRNGREAVTLSELILNPSK